MKEKKKEILKLLFMLDLLFIYLFVLFMTKRRWSYKKKKKRKKKEGSASYPNAIYSTFSIMDLCQPCPHPREAPSSNLAILPSGKYKKMVEILIANVTSAILLFYS